MKLRSSFSLRFIFLDKTIFLFFTIFLVLCVFPGIGLFTKRPRVSAYTADDFITTWNSGDDKIVKIPVYKNATGANALSSYNYTVDWGDGSAIETFITNSTDTTNPTPTHTYPNPNTEYQIVISGIFPGWTFDYNYNNLGGSTANSNMAKKLTKLNQWGTGTWKRMDSMFFNCSNLEAAYTDSPNTSQVASMYGMFFSASKFNGVIDFDTSNVTSMSIMFRDATSFNQPINFNTSKVAYMSSMFHNAASFNQSVNFTDTSSVINMSSMFQGATFFNQPVDFNTPKVTHMSSMFSGARSFNQPVNFDTSKVIDMSYMFNSATAFNQPVNFDTLNVISMIGVFLNASSFNQPVNFNTQKVTGMRSMFSGTTSFNQPVSFTDTSSVTDMSGMFNNAKIFNQSVNFTTSSVTNMASMFSGAASFNQPVNFDTSKVTNMSYMFNGATSFNRSLNFNTPKVVNMSYMFNGATYFNSSINFTDTSNATNMSYMFQGATSFNQPVDFNTSKVTNVSAMFSNARAFNQPINFNTENVTNMSSMFSYATSFNQPVNFDTSKVANMSSMFNNAISFNSPVNFTNTSNVTSMSAMFINARRFNQPLNFNTSKVTDMRTMFSYASVFNQDVSTFDFSKIISSNNLQSFARGSALSVANYDKLLNKWHTQLGSNGVSYTNVNMSPLKYCMTEVAREYLMKPVADGGAGWQLTDGGRDCSGYNVPPTGAELTNYLIPENSAHGSFVGALIATPEAVDAPGDTNTISLTCGTPAPAGATGTVGTAGVDDNLFTIQDNYEDPTIPTTLSFSSTQFTTIIPGDPTSPTYSTVPNPGSMGNPATVLVTDTNPSNLNFSTKPELHICVRVMDSYSYKYFIDKPLTIYLMKVDTPSTISLTVPTNTNITATPGIFAKHLVNAKVVTNNETGYNLTLKNNDNNTNMINTNPAIVDIISNLNSTLGGVNGTNNFLQSEFPANTWGYTLDDTSTEEHASTANYHAIPTQSNPATIKTSTTATPIGLDPTNPTGETTNLTLGFNISTSLPAGSYTDNLIFTALANPTIPKHYNYLAKLLSKDSHSYAVLVACQNTYTPTASATTETTDFMFETDMIPKATFFDPLGGTTKTVKKNHSGVCEITDW